MNPFVQNPSNSQNYNRYSYCLNNPLKYTDPSGYTALYPWYEHIAGPNTYYTHYNDISDPTYTDGSGRVWQYKAESFETANFIGNSDGSWVYKNFEKYNEIIALFNNYAETQTTRQDNLSQSNNFKFTAGAGTFRVEDEVSYNSQLKYEIIPARTSEFDGISGKLKYLFFGGNVGNWRYDINGKLTGAALIGGTAPVPSFRSAKIIQFGDHILSKSTLNALKITKEEGKIAIEAMKKANLLPPDFHGKIGIDGSFWSKTGEYIDNILDYIK